MPANHVGRHVLLPAHAGMAIQHDHVKPTAMAEMPWQRSLFFFYQILSITKGGSGAPFPGLGAKLKASLDDPEKKAMVKAGQCCFWCFEPATLGNPFKTHGYGSAGLQIHKRCHTSETCIRKVFCPLNRLIPTVSLYSGLWTGVKTSCLHVYLSSFIQHVMSMLCNMWLLLFRSILHMHDHLVPECALRTVDPITLHLEIITPP